MAENPNKNRWTLAACTFAVAAAVGSTTSAAAAQVSAPPQAIDQIQRYCARSWQNAGIAPQDWQDCTQQALLELLERISNRGLASAIDDVESQERRELNRTVWRTIQRWRRRPKHAVLHDSPTLPEAAAGAGENTAWDEVLRAARAMLTSRQQRILELTREGWKAGEIAGKLGLSSARVSDEKYKSICKLRDHLQLAQFG